MISPNSPIRIYWKQVIIIAMSAFSAFSCSKHQAGPEVSPPPPAPPPNPFVQAEPGVDGKYETLFRFQGPPATREVILTGDWAEWNPKAEAMKPLAGKPGEWTVSVRLAKGAHAYKFVLDGGTWMPGPDNPRVEPDGVSGFNSIVYVGYSEAEVAIAETQRREKIARSGIAAPGPGKQEPPPKTPEEAFARRVGLGEPQAAAAATPREADPPELNSLWIRGVGVSQLAQEARALIERLAAADSLPLVRGRAVTFMLWAPEARGPISVAGDFNQWHSSADTLKRLGDTPFYHLTLRLPDSADALQTPAVRYCFVEWLPREAETAPSSPQKQSQAASRENLDTPDISRLSPRPFLDPSNRRIEYDGFPKVSALAPSPGSGRGTLWQFSTAFAASAPSWLLPREIFVWTPPGYDAPANAARRYPVLYMHDGQNLWEQRYTGPFGQGGWEVDRWIERLAAKGEIEPAIVVGMGNTSTRLRDYNLGADVFTPSTQPYMEMLVKDLKPAIDQAYRTLPDREHTSVMGSSMGGVISFLLAWHHPETFGQAGCLSTAFEPKIICDGSGRQLFDLVEKGRNPDQRPARLYLDSGTAGQGQDNAPESQRLAEMLRARGWNSYPEFEHFVAQGAVHNEEAWRNRLDHPLRFLLGPKAPRK